MFYQNHLQPFLKKPSAETLLPILRFLGAAALGGTLIAMGRAALFGYPDPGPDEKDINKALENKDTARAVALVCDRAWHSMVAAGALGFFGNYIQFGLDWRDQQRVKSPIDPPGIGALKPIYELAQRWLEQGKLTGRDVDELAEQGLSFYRAWKRGTTSTLDMVGAEHAEVKRFAARKELLYVRKQIRRYMDDQDLEGKKTTSSGRFAKTHLSPANREIAAALMVGEPARAKEIVKKELAKAKSKAEREKILASMRASLRLRQPIVVGSSSSAEQKTRFLIWAKKNLDAGSYARIKEADIQFVRGAKRIGLM